MTVKEIKESLKDKDDNLPIVKLEMEGNSAFFDKLEVIYPPREVTFINDLGDDEKGEAIIIY